MTQPGKRGTIISINISKRKGQIKKPVPSAQLLAGQGIKNDAHINFGHRQVSFLMNEQIQAQKQKWKDLGIESCGEIKGKKIELAPGVFAENFTTQNIDLSGLKIGDQFLVGGKIRLKVSQIGKECHTRCAIYKVVGDCIMPVLGIFCEVLDSGEVKVGDEIERL
jgi:molybdopterin adenylyltransferase